MDSLLRNAYIISTILLAFVIILFCPYSLYIFKRYIGSPGYIAFSIAALIWSCSFILIGLFFYPRK